MSQEARTLSWAGDSVENMKKAAAAKSAEAVKVVLALASGQE